ncbi:hypothetical protein FCV25MIE_08945 [Fagus crenata]
MLQFSKCLDSKGPCQPLYQSGFRGPTVCGGGSDSISNWVKARDSHHFSHNHCRESTPKQSALSGKTAMVRRQICQEIEILGDMDNPKLGEVPRHV